MKKHVNIDNTAHRPDGVYSNVIKKITDDGVCPFCTEHLLTYHKNPILEEGSEWLLTTNMYPYEGAKHHLLVIHKKHIETATDISKSGWAELKTLLDTWTKKLDIPGGTLVMRFGETDYTGASVTHLHANIVSSHGPVPDRKPIIARVG